jgi:Ca2+/Na+ antiporter
VAIVFVAVLPVSLVWLLVTTSLWEWPLAAGAAAMHAATGIALVELTLIGRRSIPFTREHIATVSTLRADWIFGLVALHVFAFRLDDLQLAALGSSNGVALYILATAIVIGMARLYRRLKRTEGDMEFDAPTPDAAATLNLSQATG